MFNSDYIKKNLELLDNYDITIENLTKKLCIDISKECGVKETEDLSKKISMILSKYRYGLIDNNVAIRDLENIYNNSKQQNSNNNGTQSSTPNNSIRNTSTSSNTSRVEPSINTENVVDIDTETVIASSDQYSEVESSVTSADVDIPGSVSPYSSAISEVVSSTKSAIVSSLEGIKSTLVDVLNSVMQLDDDSSKIDASNMTFEDIKSFYYHFQGDAKEVKPLSEAAMRELFEKNGATREGDIYTFTVDGVKYGYNVTNYQISVDGVEKKFYTRFFLRDDTSYNDITNTITILAGQDAVNTNTGPCKGEWNLFEGVEAQKSSLVVVPYGREYGSIGYSIAPGASAATRIGNFMVGGQNRKITNSIVGYSLGGMAAYRAVEQNKGLYNKIVAVNTFQSAKEMEKYNATYDAYEGVEIIMLEARGDQFLSGSRDTCRRLVKNGVPPESITYYTNDPSYANYVAQEIGEERVVFLGLNDKKTPNYDPDWVTHNHGIRMIKSSGILVYLGQ